MGLNQMMNYCMNETNDRLGKFEYRMAQKVVVTGIQQILHVILTVKLPECSADK